MEQKQTPTVPDRSRKLIACPGVIRPVATGRQRVLRIRASMPLSREWFMAAARQRAVNPRQAQYHLVREARVGGSASSMPTQAVRSSRATTFGLVNGNNRAPGGGKALCPPSPIHVRLLTIPGDGKGL